MRTGGEQRAASNKQQTANNKQQTTRDRAMTFTIVVSLVTFVAVVAVVGVLGFVLRDGGNKAAGRLDTLVGKKRKGDSQADILRKTAFEGDKKSILEMITPKSFNLHKYFEQADCNIKPNTIMGIGALLAGVGVTGSWVAGVPWVFMPLTPAGLFVVPFGWVWNKRRARMNKFASQLPDALELVARALRAGHSLQAGMHVVAEEMPSPISDEFNRVYEEQNLGIAIEESMESMCGRVPNLD